MAVGTWPEAFAAKQMAVTDGTQYVRLGGKGPAVLLLHGFGDTGDMWVPLADALVKDHAVIVPDLRGMGLSSIPRTVTKRSRRLETSSAFWINLGPGSRSRYPRHRQHGGLRFCGAVSTARDKMGGDGRATAGDRPLGQAVETPEGLALQLSWPRRRAAGRGRDRLLLDRFYNELSANPSRIDEQTRDHYAALYARPYAIHNAFGGQYAAFAQDAIDNQQLVAKGKLKMPVLAIGGDHSYGAHLATAIGFAAADVRAAVIKDSGHWIMEEQPEQAVSIILSFLKDE